MRTIEMCIRDRYTFTLKEDVLREFSREVQHAMEEYIHHEFKSLEILEVLAGGKMTSPISWKCAKGLEIMLFKGYNMPYVWKEKEENEEKTSCSSCCCDSSAYAWRPVSYTHLSIFNRIQDTACSQYRTASYFRTQCTGRFWKVSGKRSLCRTCERIFKYLLKRNDLSGQDCISGSQLQW